MVNRYLALKVVLLTGVLQGSAQKVSKFNRFVDSVLTVRYWRANLDTNYITRPQTKWTVVGRLNVSGARIKAMGKVDDKDFETNMRADYKTTVSVGVSYLGLSLNLSLNPAKLLGKYHDYELSFRSYGKTFGFDISYQDASNFKGWHEEEGRRYDFTTSDDMFKLRTLNVNAYYVFNNRRFSFPAAFAHSYIQRRLAGSFLLAASGQGQHGKVNSEKGFVDFKMTNIGIGAGYGYNYVPGTGWLLHLSALPTFIVYSNTANTVNDNEFPLSYHFPEVIITGRGAVVRQWGNKFFGMSMIFNFTNIGHKESLEVHNIKWHIRTYFGIRL